MPAVSWKAAGVGVGAAGEADEGRGGVVGFRGRGAHEVGEEVRRAGELPHRPGVSQVDEPVQPGRPRRQDVRDTARAPIPHHDRRELGAQQLRQLRMSGAQLGLRVGVLAEGGDGPRTVETRRGGVEDDAEDLDLPVARRHEAAQRRRVGVCGSTRR